MLFLHISQLRRSSVSELRNNAVLYAIDMFIEVCNNSVIELIQCVGTSVI